MKLRNFKFIETLTFILALICGGTAPAFADNWQVVKMSGEAWISSEKPQKVALSKGKSLNLGDKIQTGTNGKVLLKRGKETIMVMPNSIMALPETKQEKGKTKIYHHLGQIELDVEKRNVKHFEVMTPYLVAIVKGTKFKVEVNDKGAKVGVQRGKVEVSNHITGKFVLVKPGQLATVLPQGGSNQFKLNISGKGKKATIKQGQPRKPEIEPAVKSKLKLQKSAGKKLDSKNKKLTTLKPAKQKTFKTSKVKKVSKTISLKADNKLKVKNKNARQLTKKVRQKTLKRKIRKRRVRIGKAIGSVKLNYARVTKGLSRAKIKNHRHNKKKNTRVRTAVTYWKNPSAYTPASTLITTNNNNSGNGNDGNNGNGNGNDGNNGNGNGNNGNNGNGNGNNGNNGNGNGNNGNNGNGNGNNGNGNDDDD